MSLRIAGGLFRGRAIKTHTSTKTRPTTARVREAVFNICREWVPNAKFLDLFAGSGAMGFEAISRGAAFATLVEHDPQAVLCIQTTIEQLKLQQQIQLLALDAPLALKRLMSPFDLIYIDPPYGHDATELFQLILQRQLLASQGLLFYEAKEPIVKNIDPALELVDSRRYGITHLHQFRHAVIQPPA